MSKKILVAGGAGYIGSHTIVELANEGYEPIIVDDFSNSQESVLNGLEKIIGRKISFYKVNCVDEKSLNEIFELEKNIHGVIHFAAFKAVGESVENPLKYYKNNLNSLMSLISSMKKNKIKNLVFSSSCTVYGIPDSLPINEEAPIKLANSPYGNTKKISEEIIKDCLHSNDLKKAVLLRYFNPIGAHESALIGELPIGEPDNLVPRITQKAAGILEGFKINGDNYDTLDGTCIRDYIHVVDLAKAHVKALEYFGKSSKRLGIFNIGTGKGTSVLELINTFENVSGKKFEYEIGEKREGDIPEIYADVKKANGELDWKAEFSIENALSSAWKWQKKIS
tara:strand:- start:42 stop:1055 length:1014 start_codon:yes stop_codon:yes gene_type:complete